MYNIDLSNGAIFIDLERLIPTVSRSFHFLTQNISEMVRDADSFNGILIRTYTRHTMTRTVARSVLATAELLILKLVNVFKFLKFY